ncbi:MAG: rRNA maturation RNase YbeY [Brumimicrobium sp.]
MEIEIEFIDVPKINLDYLTEWYKKIALSEGKVLGEFSIIIGTDEWLILKNIEFLNHDFYTDIITFDYCEGNIVSGDLLISYERVVDNAKTFNSTKQNELNRVLVHGLLHLCGYNDKTEEDSKIMREKEDFYLQLL